MEGDSRKGCSMVTLARVCLRDALLCVCLGDGRILFYSREAPTHLGLSQSFNLIGLNFIDLLEAQDRPDFRACVTRPSSSCLLKCRSGALLWLDVQPARLTPRIRQAIASLPPLQPPHDSGPTATATGSSHSLPTATTTTTTFSKHLSSSPARGQHRFGGPPSALRNNNNAFSTTTTTKQNYSSTFPRLHHLHQHHHHHLSSSCNLAGSGSSTTRRSSAQRLQDHLLTRERPLQWYMSSWGAWDDEGGDGSHHHHLAAAGSVAPGAGELSSSCSEAESGATSSASSSTWGASEASSSTTSCTDSIPRQDFSFTDIFQYINEQQQRRTTSQARFSALSLNSDGDDDDDGDVSDDDCDHHPRIASRPSICCGPASAISPGEWMIHSRRSGILGSRALQEPTCYDEETTTGGGGGGSGWDWYLELEPSPVIG